MSETSEKIALGSSFERAKRDLLETVKDPDQREQLGILLRLFGAYQEYGNDLSAEEFVARSDDHPRVWGTMTDMVNRFHAVALGQIESGRLKFESTTGEAPIDYRALTRRVNRDVNSAQRAGERFPSVTVRHHDLVRLEEAGKRGPVGAVEALLSGIRRAFSKRVSRRATAAVEREHLDGQAG